MLTGNSSSRKEASDGSCLLNRVPSLFIRLLGYWQIRLQVLEEIISQEEMRVQFPKESVMDIG